MTHDSCTQDLISASPPPLPFFLVKLPYNTDYSHPYKDMSVWNTDPVSQQVHKSLSLTPTEQCHIKNLQQMQQLLSYKMTGDISSQTRVCHYPFYETACSWFHNKCSSQMRSQQEVKSIMCAIKMLYQHSFRHWFFIQTTWSFFNFCALQSSTHKY